jgi:hypothetical protein
MTIIHDVLTGIELKNLSPKTHFPKKPLFIYLHPIIEKKKKIITTWVADHH